MADIEADIGDPTEVIDDSKVTDGIRVELNGRTVQGTKGPDPKVWGAAHTAPPVKGPDPEQHATAEPRPRTRQEIAEEIQRTGVIPAGIGIRHQEDDVVIEAMLRSLEES